MTYFAGLDISLQETAVCILDQDGNIQKEASIPTDPQSLIEFLRSLPYPIEKVGMEACTFAAWLHDGFTDAGYKTVCMNAAHTAAAIQAMQRNKTDRNDAQGIAQLLRTGWYREVHIKSEESRRVRMLLTNRKALVRQRVDLDNTLRSVLKEYGLKMGKGTHNHKFTERIKELIQDMPHLVSLINPLLEVRQKLLDEIRTLDKLLLDYAKNDAVCRLFMTIPGVGPVTATTFKTTIDVPDRFRKSANVGAYVGLTPRKYASGETDYNGRISRAGDASLREALYEAASSLLTRFQGWCSLKSWGLRIAKRSCMKNARVAVARKLAVIMHSMWQTGEAFRYNQQEVEAA